MLSENDNKIDIEEENDNKVKNICLNDIKEKYNNIIQNNTQNISFKEINCLKNLLEDNFAVNKFNEYINDDFLENCELKLVFMPEEFIMKEENKFYFAGFGDKKRKKGNLKHKNNKKFPITEAKKNKRKFDS